MCSYFLLQSKTVLTESIQFNSFCQRASNSQNAMPCPSTSPDPGSRKAGWSDERNRVMGMDAGLLAWEHSAMSCMWLSPRSVLLNVGTQGHAAAFEGKRYR